MNIDLFIINPISGDTDKITIANAISQFSLKRRTPYAVLYTTDKNDEVTIKQTIDLYQPERVIVCGGDGTFNLVASLLLGSQVKLGLIPAGSANGLATELKIPSSINEALEVLNRNKLLAIDGVRFNDSLYSFHLSDFGFNAKMIAEFEKQGTRGMISYAKAFFKSLSDETVASYELSVNGKTIEREAEMIVIANAARYGTGAVVSPSSKLHDGYFEIVVFKPIPRVKLVNLTLSAFLGSLENSPYVEIIRAKKAHIATKTPQYFQVDGQVQGRLSEVSVGIVENAINVLVP